MLKLRCKDMPWLGCLGALWVTVWYKWGGKHTARLHNGAVAVVADLAKIQHFSCCAKLCGHEPG